MWQNLKRVNPAKDHWQKKFQPGFQNLLNGLPKVTRVICPARAEVPGRGVPGGHPGNRLKSIGVKLCLIPDRFKSVQITNHNDRNSKFQILNVSVIDFGACNLDFF
jgi:hypothetical protein